MRVPPNAGAQHDDALRLGGDLADDGRRGAERVARASPPARRRPRRAATTATTLPSLATYSGSMPRRSHAPSTAGATGQRGLLEDDGDVGVAGQLVAHRADAAAGGVAEPAGRRRGRQHAPRRGRSPAPCPSGCRPPGRGRRVPASPPSRGRRSCRTRAPGRPAAPAPGRASRPAGITPDAGRRDEQAVGGARADDLGVAGHDRHAGRGGRLGHVGDDRPQLGDRRSPPRSRTRPTATPAGRPARRRR